MKFVTLATAGMTSASGGGVLFGEVVTPGMLLTEIVRLMGVVASADKPPAAAVVVISTLPVLVPAGRPAVWASARRVCPPGGTMPLAGVTESHGTVGVAVKLWPASSAPMLSV